MKILVDADSCPRPARDLIIRAARRTGLTAIFAANRPIPGLRGDTVIMELCPPGDGSADNRVVDLARQGDVVITRDIPLAQRLVEKDVTVMDDRGTVYSRENIRERLSLRNFMVGLANNGLDPERSASYGKQELKAMADSLDRLLAKLNHGELKKPT
ncbi:MAG: DUF188 domain-containing protein [Treponema sp.]|jgi:uncharacterized protein YaiI (UPF0178 family)|nr:DUF188 domain-containing protein [Treponema sp.]